MTLIKYLYSLDLKTYQMMIPLNHPINSEKQEGTETILLI